MKKCVDCHKEFENNFIGNCPDCGGKVEKAKEVVETTVEKGASRNKKKLIMFDVVLAVIVIAVIAFFAIGSNGDKASNGTDAKQEQKQDNKKDDGKTADASDSSDGKAEDAGKEPADNAKKEDVPVDHKKDDGKTADASNSSDGKAEDAGKEPADNAKEEDVPVDHIEKAEDIQTGDELTSLINESNDPDTDPERKEEILEILGEYLEGFESETITLTEDE